MPHTFLNLLWPTRAIYEFSVFNTYSFNNMKTGRFLLLLHLPPLPPSLSPSITFLLQKILQWDLENRYLSKDVSFQVPSGKSWRHMTWELRHDFKMAATLDPPDWISLFPQNLTKPHKSTKGKKKKKKKVRKWYRNSKFSGRKLNLSIKKEIYRYEENLKVKKK